MVFQECVIYHGAYSANILNCEKKPDRKEEGEPPRRRRLEGVKKEGRKRDLKG